MSTIQWTDETWNPSTGCTKISPGCANCYIERTPPMRMHGRKFVNGRIPLEFHEDRLDAPLHWKKPRRVFVNSMSDLFHEDVPGNFLDSVFRVMIECRQHTFQVLTKRAKRMQKYVGDRWGVFGGKEHPLGPNIWLGVSVEDQKRADERIPLLLQTPAAVRFLSCEPLLGLVVLDTFHGGRPHYLTREVDHAEDVMLDWVIVGGESGPGSRACNMDWIRSIVQQCNRAGVACFVKQVGSNASGDSQLHQIDCQCGLHHGFKDKKGGDPEEWPEDLRVREFPK